jgi:hypothetical protein
MSPRRRAWRFEHERALKSPLRRAKPSAKMNPTRGGTEAIGRACRPSESRSEQGGNYWPAKGLDIFPAADLACQSGPNSRCGLSEGSSIAGDETWHPNMWRREQLAAPVRRRDLHSEPIWITHGEIVASGALHAFDTRALDPGP